jgi:hypothetical protein
MHEMNFFTVPLERRNKQSSLWSEIEWVNVNKASDNKSDVEPAKVLAVTYNYGMGKASCEASHFPVF